MAATTSDQSTGRSVGLHPLAIVGVSDHFTRVKMGGGRQASDASRPVLGLLFGQQKGLEVTVVDAIELARTDAGGVDHEFLAQNVELYTDVYKDRELIGWYSLAKDAGAEHLALHKEFLQYNESPLLLLMDPAPDADARDLPVTILEAQVQVVDGAPQTLFAAVPFQLETLQAERIAMEHVAKAGPAVGEAALDAHVDAVDASLHTLGARVRVLRDHLKAVDAGEIPPDHGLLRQLGQLCDQLPAFGGDETLDDAFLRDYNDALLASYLATVTKHAAAVNDLSDKLMLVNSRGSKLV
mmetsp:Transcript_26622/g.81866  ORF Transcript_26622/g.81866 Transcript_26622/m.81866 type:complete len:297 (-) Transcript_26622:43-933(-)